MTINANVMYAGCLTGTENGGKWKFSHSVSATFYDKQIFIYCISMKVEEIKNVSGSSMMDDLKNHMLLCQLLNDKSSLS